METPQHPTLDHQQKFWNWHWDHWQERKTINEWKKIRHKAVVDYLRVLPLNHPKILDLGCGPGWFTETLSDYGTVTGIDLSETAIRVAQSRFPQITFIAGNLYEVPLPLNHFDLVVSQEVIDHVEDQAAFVHRAASFLKSGGYLILSCSNKFVMDRLGKEEFPSQPPGHIADYLNKKSLKDLLSSGFQVIGLRSILPVVGRRGILRLINSQKLNTLAGFIIPRRYLDLLKEKVGFGYQLIVLAQKRS